MVGRRTSTADPHFAAADLSLAATSARTPLPAVSISAACAPIAPGVQTMARPKLVNSTEAIVASRKAPTNRVRIEAQVAAAYRRRVRTMPATIRTMPTMSPPPTAPPKIAIDNRKPPTGVNARTCPATAADIIDSTRFHRK
jgi:hypothetical protein